MDSLQKLIGFLGRHFGPPRLFLLVAGWVLALGVWGMVARNWLPMEHKIQWEIPLELRAPLYAKFDSGWYLSIMDWGYGPPPPVGKPSSHAFFPLYPFTAKVFRDTFAMDGFHAGLLVSYLCLFLAASLFLREGIARLGEETGWRSVFFLLLFPTAFYFAAVYAESMELLFALLAFRDARRGETLRAALWGALLGLTRAFALAAGPALFLAALEAPRPAGARRYLRAVVPGGRSGGGRLPLDLRPGMGQARARPLLPFDGGVAPRIEHARRRRGFLSGLLRPSPVGRPEAASSPSRSTTS